VLVKDNSARVEVSRSGAKLLPDAVGRQLSKNHQAGS